MASKKAVLEAKLAGLSKRARKMYDRVQSPANWYPAMGPEPKGAMKELVDAGLVGTMGRVVLVQRFYVPTDAIPLKHERYPSYEKAQS